MRVKDKTVSDRITVCISNFIDVTSRIFREDGFTGVTREPEGTPLLLVVNMCQME